MEKNTLPKMTFEVPFEQRKSVMKKLIEELTTTGKEELNMKVLQILLDHAGVSEEAMRVCSNQIFEQMRIEHAQVRYGALMVLNELVNRSAFYRSTILFKNMEMLLELTKLTVEGTVKVAKRGRPKKLLPKFVTEKLKTKALEILVKWHYDHGLDMNRNYIPRAFNYITKNLGITLPEPRFDPGPAKLTPNKMAVDAVRKEFEESEENLVSTLQEIATCFEILVPRNDLGEIVHKEEDYSKEHDSAGSPSMFVFVAQNGLINIVRDEDNETILENLLGLYKIITVRHLPNIKRWLGVLEAENHLGSSETALLQRLEEFEMKMGDEICRYERLNIKTKQELVETDTDTDDSDFEEVRAIPEWMELSSLGLGNFQPSSTASNDGFNLPLHQSPIKSSVGSPMMDMSGRALSPINNACRAPLRNGNLCPRRDFEKCPFHGKIVARDDAGVPLNVQDREAENKRLREAKAKETDWQGDKHLKNLKRVTGMDLSMTKRSRRQLSFEEKYPGLISLKTEDTARQRLARKMRNSKSNKRLRTSLNLDQGTQPF